MTTLTSDFFYVPMAALAALSFIAGCSTAPIELQTKGKRRFSAADQIDVHLVGDQCHRTDPFVMAIYGKDRHPVATGPVWCKLFVGTSSSAGSFEIDNAVVNAYSALGFAARYTYQIDGRFSYKGKTYAVAASGTRAASSNKSNAMTEAVELGILDAVNQSQTLMNRHRFD